MLDNVSRISAINEATDDDTDSGKENQKEEKQRFSKRRKVFPAPSARFFRTFFLKIPTTIELGLQGRTIEELNVSPNIFLVQDFLTESEVAWAVQIIKVSPLLSHANVWLWSLF